MPRAIEGCGALRAPRAAAAVRRAPLGAAELRAPLAATRRAPLSLAKDPP
jgi:hypothetical protein